MRYIGNMTAMEPPREVTEPRATGDRATPTTPRIVNGLPVRHREKVNVWGFVAILFVPGIWLLFALVFLGVHRLLRYLDARGMLLGRPDVRK
jgi:hypothetical protein